MGKDKDMEYSIIQTDLNMQGIENIIKKMEKESGLEVMEILMRVNFYMGRNEDLEF